MAGPYLAIPELARERRIDLLTGDVTSDDTLAYCDLRSAMSFVATTDSDTANLEAALGARAQNPNLSVIMRITDPVFAGSIERNFTLTKSFSTSELTAPLIAGLASVPGCRGRVTFQDVDYSVVEHPQGEIPEPPAAAGSIPLFVRRGGNLVPLRDFAEMRPYDRVLYATPQRRAQRPAT